jgi:hypothetical protein
VTLSPTAQREVAIDAAKVTWDSPSRVTPVRHAQGANAIAKDGVFATEAAAHSWLRTKDIAA